MHSTPLALFTELALEQLEGTRLGSFAHFAQRGEVVIGEHPFELSAGLFD
jgi:hypothetical protein